MPVQGDILEVTVVGCTNLRDTEWLSKQDPYVILEYGGTRYRTRTDTDGGTNPRFNEKYMFSYIQGISEISISVWNSNTLAIDDFIGAGKILLQRAIIDGYHDTTWPITTKHGRTSGDVRVILHFGNQQPYSSSTHNSTAYNNHPHCYTYPPTAPSAAGPPPGPHGVYSYSPYQPPPSHAPMYPNSSPYPPAPYPSAYPPPPYYPPPHYPGPNYH